MINKIPGIEVRYYLKDRWIGTKQDLAKVFGLKSIRSIQRNIDSGMPEHEESSEKLRLFDIENCIQWKKRNVNLEQSKRTKKNQADEDEEGKEFSDEEEQNIVDSLTDKQLAKIIENNAYLRKIVGDADKSVEEAARSKLKRQNEEGELVDADDLDKAMAELAVMHKTDRTNDEKILPILLEQKTSQEISALLYEHNKDRLDLLSKIIKKEFDCEETLYDIIEEVLLLQEKGFSDKDIINKLKK